MSAKKDLSGMTFGKLTVIGHAPSTPAGRAQWFCKCECGKYGVFMGKRLLSGMTKSCGCRRVEAILTTIAKKSTRHGMSRTRTWRTWECMRARCSNPNARAYEQYGGRGITVCSRWQIFENFYADMGERPDGMTLDRVDVNGNYEPGNCRWATSKEQARNRRNNRKFNGKTAAEIAEKAGANYVTTRKRLIRAEMAAVRPVGLPPVGQGELFQ